MGCRVEADVELRVVADLDVAAAGDSYRAFVEGQIAELGFLLPATGPESRVPRGKRLAQRVASLGNESGDDAVERRAVVVARTRLTGEVRDRFLGPKSSAFGRKNRKPLVASQRLQLRH